jgi:diguanylate cyclase (GGDEF)-like protein
MATNRNLRIIIIDDNPEIHKDFIKILSTKVSGRGKLDSLEKELFGSEGDATSKLPYFEIDTASQGQEGVERIAAALKEGRPYALAFVDIRMPPGWDGIVTIKHIWELDPDIQIVICSAYSDYSWEETVEQLGQRENLLILKKPFDNVAVRQLSCALTKKWQLLQESREYTSSLEERVKERTSLLQQSLSVARGTLESSADGIMAIDENNKIIDYNNKFIEIWNISSLMLETKDATVVLEHIANQLEDSDNFFKLIQELSNKLDIVKIDKLKTNNDRIFEHYSQPYLLHDKFAGRIWSFRDITIRAKLEEKLEYQATHDALTGLANRTLLVDRISRAIATAKRNNAQFGLLFFDLDRFKLINDSLGHMAGDQLLQDTTHRIQASIREEDTFARLGGDEFVIVITTMKDKRDLGRIADKILTTFNEPFRISDRNINVSASFGISIYPTEGKDPDELLRYADIAMYRAKGKGGKQFQFYNAELSRQSMELLEIETDLRKAVAENEFFIWYQPEQNMASQAIFSVEALLRWQHPTKGVLLPIDFIPLAEETGLIIPLGEWVLRTACKQTKHWHDRGHKVCVAVNIANKQFKKDYLPQLVKSILAETKLPPEFLELELTETVIINNADSVETISALKDIGIIIALDDFGSGYSSLNYLSKIRVDRLKIDQSFVKNIDINRGDEVIIQAIISMAKDLNLEVLAEGVETKRQLEFLKSKHCAEIQGFYLSHPLSAVDLEKFLEARLKVESAK